VAQLPWTASVTSALRTFLPSSRKIPVYPVSLGSRQPLALWSGYYALGCLTAYAKVHEGGVLAERFEFGRVSPAYAERVNALAERHGVRPGVHLLSCYVWNHDVNAAYARALKQRSPSSLVVVGGPHVPRDPAALQDFMDRHPYVDVAVRHEGEVTLAEILRAIQRDDVEPRDLVRADLGGVEGLTFRRRGELVRTGDRARTMDLSGFPSPYTTGEFDEWIDGALYVPLETNRGCPYGCAFCDWGAATLSKLGRMSIERVFAEIEFAAQHRAENIGICDANFGILPRDVEIAQHIVKMHDQYGYPREVGYTNAKTATPRLTEIVKLLAGSGLIQGGQISMQTTDEGILDNVKRSNIRMSEYRKMIAFFHGEGIPAVSDIMLGLPGQTFETCKKDLQFCFDHKVIAMVFATSVMPNAPMADAEYRKKFAIEVGADGYVEATYSFTREEYRRMFDLCLAYKLFVKHGVLKYLMYFMQIEHGVPAIFLERWLERTQQSPDLYPISNRILIQLIERDRQGGLRDWLSLAWTDDQAGFLFEAMEEFQAEILEFFAREHGVRAQGSDLDAVLAANREIMPKKGRSFPRRVPLPHDVADYFTGIRKLPSLNPLPESHQPLKARGPGFLDLAEQAATTTYGFVDLISLVGRLELASNLRV
jgi:radical SAM superfamily enzyme YgiQ (UPF0313 family)